MEEIEKVEILKEIGLTDGEIKVYLSLLNKGTQTASQLARNTRLNRSNLYRILERLIEKKLVFSSIIEKTKYFSITRVERVKELYNEKIEELKEKEKQIKEFVKNAEKLSEVKLPREEFVVEVHEGAEEIKRVIEHVLTLKKGETVYAIGKEGVLAEYPGIKFWVENLFRKRAKKRIKFVAVYNWHENAKRAKSPYTEVRYANLVGMGDIEISFYRNTLLIYIMTKEKPRVILIRSKDIVLAMISYFKFLWDKAKKM